MIFDQAIFPKKPTATTFLFAVGDWTLLLNSESGPHNILGTIACLRTSPSRTVTRDIFLGIFRTTPKNNNIISKIRTCRQPYLNTYSTSDIP